MRPAFDCMSFVRLLLSVAIYDYHILIGISLAANHSHIILEFHARSYSTYAMLLLYLLIFIIHLCTVLHFIVLVRRYLCLYAQCSRLKSLYESRKKSVRLPALPRVLRSACVFCLFCLHSLLLYFYVRKERSVWVCWEIHRECTRAVCMCAFMLWLSMSMACQTTPFA